MSVTVILGVQWGDEGKGKIVDLLSDEAEYVVRFQGGPNAGHTIVVDGEQTVLHLVPSGMLHPDRVCVVGNGVVINLEGFFTELEGLTERGVAWEGRLRVSERAHGRRWWMGPASRRSTLYIQHPPNFRHHQH